jgi:hypothetical protein
MILIHHPPNPRGEVKLPVNVVKTFASNIIDPQKILRAFSSH